MNENRYYVYKHTNNINGKIYIGITSQIPKNRWLNGKGYLGNDYFTKSINKYGWNNFNHEILYENLKKEEAEQKEQELIAYHKSNNRDFGYNIDNGGKTNRFTDETKKKIGESHKGKPAWNKGLHINIGENNSFYGHHHSEETKKKISAANKGRKKTLEQLQKVSQSCKKTWKEKIANGYVFTEEQKRKLSEANKGKPSRFKGHHHSEETKEKLRLSHLGKKQSKEAIEKTAKKNRKPILCFDKKMNFIKEFDSTISASKELNIHSSNITRSLKHPSTTAKGYKFRYKENFNEE